MQSSLSHIYLYVSDLAESMGFYKMVLESLGYEHTYTADWGTSFSKDGTDIWLEQVPEDRRNDYHRRNPGLNHLAFRVESKDNVNVFYEEVLKPGNIKVLYGSPKEYPEYSEEYYAVFFEDPDGIKIEVTYHSNH